MWTRIIAPLPRDWHSKGTARRQRDLAKRFAELAKRRASAEETRDSALSADVAEVDPDRVFQLDVPAATQFELLRDELALRRDLAEFYQHEERDRIAETENAHQRMLDVEQSVRERLVSIGYVDPGPRLTGAIGEFTPDFLQRHPEVRAAREAERAIKATSFREHEAQNAGAIDEVRGELERLRLSAVTP